MTTLAAEAAPAGLGASARATATELAARIAVPRRLPPRYDGQPMRHLSNSSYTRFLLCPEDWRRHYLLGERFPPSGAMFVEHLDAALAVWRYSADSTRWIFGDSLGDPTADEIWAAARERPAGLTRTDVSDMFSRNKKRREIERALNVLQDAERLRRETRQPERGRSAEVWIPILAEAA